ncbi:serine/threonine-protein kinase [Myxococcus sp. AB025B]|uniref:serine/threonine protein kinase n=1 Tax=Myxococcus sp. AB025B TaxID=2562794 RepID=UPI001142A694|nr:serine/threonine-protein kinase [Myxococcus sp. AB025B]
MTPLETLIDGWQVSRELGSGGFAFVFLGEKNGKSAALKVARHREASGDSKQTHARTLRELTALLMLEHRNVVRPQGYGYTLTGNVYLALDYVDGWTLAEWAERKHPTFREIIRVFEKVVGALSYMHGRGVLHRDLKLSNVLVRKSDGEPVIIDFSCATYTLAEELTDGGLPPGTDRYRAPEQFKFLQEHKDEHRARYAFQVADEIFAVGVMLHELLTDPRPMELHARFDLNDPRYAPPAPRLVNARIPEALSELVEGILSRCPSRRPVDTESLRRELAELRDDPVPGYDVPAHAPSEQRQLALAVHEGTADSLPPEYTPRKWQGGLTASSRRAGRWGVAIVGAVALVVGVALWRYPAAKREPPMGLGVASVPRAPTAPDSSPPRMGPPAMSLSAPFSLDTPGLALVAAQKEGSTVMTPPAESPTQGRAARMSKKFVAAAECASSSLVAALAAGCPGAQIRPESFTCPAGAEQAMLESLRWTYGDRFSLVLDDRHGVDDKVWFTAGGDVVGVVPKGTNDERQREVAPVGTRFYGKAYYLSDKMGRADGPALVVRYDRVKLPGQDEQPICFVVEGTVLAYKDGRVKARNWNGGIVVARWP